MASPRILVFAGSARTGSFNKRLAQAASGLAEAAGADVTFADLRDHPMPLYDGDSEAADGVPDSVRAWKELMMAHDGFLIAAPEYNGSLTPLLKNAIDWASRATEENETPLRAFRGKTAGLLAASPGSLGGLRGLAHLRTILAGIGVLVVPTQCAVPQAHKAFDENGGLADDGTRKRVVGVVNSLIEVTRAVLTERV